MNNAAVDREDGPVTGAVPGSVGVIPCHGAAFMSARRRNSMGYAVGPFPHSDPASAEIHYCAATWLDVVEAVHQGSAVAALVEFSWDLAHGVVDRRPIGRAAEDLLSDQDAGRGAIAYAPGVEPSGDVEARRFRQCAGKWNAVSGIVVLVDPPPGGVADPRRSVAVRAGHIPF